MKNKIDKKVLDLAKKLKIEIVFSKDELRGTCDARLTFIILNPKRATNYDALHEISHVICGYGCCREHCEFEAHGGAKVLCKLLGLSKGNAEIRMDSYAQRTNPICCGRFKKKDSWVEELKREIVIEVIKELNKMYCANEEPWNAATAWQVAEDLGKKFKISKKEVAKLYEPKCSHKIDSDSRGKK